MPQANLMLHCGAAAVTRDQVFGVRTPDRTRTWVPVPHGNLVARVQDSLERAGLHVVSEAHGLTRDGNRYFGLLQVQNGHPSDEFGLVVGIRNSHDQSFPVALALGATVFVCDNLSFSGQVKLARKHTSRVELDLPQIVDRGVGLLGDLRRSQETRFSAYRNRELTDGQAHDLVIQAIDGRIVPVTRIPELLTEWRTPRHPEFCQGRTAWRLFNAFTEILKGRLGELPARTQALHGLLDAACGLVCQPAPAAIAESAAIPTAVAA